MKVLWFLHGNLQQPMAWQPFISVFQPQHPGFQVHLIDLWKTLTASSSAWASDFCNGVKPLSIAVAENYLVGYSLGGRLAWYAMLADPRMWSGAIIVSADIGLSDQQEKEQCLSRDRNWAHRFLTEPWDDLLAEWDALPVFCGRPCPTPRPEADFDRQKIARAFEVYSKGRMDDLRSQLTTLPMPITYITGEADRRYHHIGESLAAQVPNIQHISIANAGHRVPWEQPDAFLAAVINAIS